ncbi:MAG: ThuA domain-containing protein [Pseudomonadota bacterium]
MSEHKTVSVYLVCAGDYHDIDYARLELLKLLAEHEAIRVEVAGNYHDLEAIAASDVLITYTCNLVPSDAEQLALRDYVSGGGKWFALHGTNSILKFLEDGRVDSPETAPVLMETLGTQFLAHPPIQPFKVHNVDPDHPLVAGIGEFETDDELYLCRIHGELHTLLDTRFVGEAAGFVHSDWPDDVSHPVYYRKTQGAGEVLYLNLGHCRGHYDMQPMIDYYPNIERGSWDKPEYYELLRRGIRYCAGIAS